MARRTKAQRDVLQQLQSKLQRILNSPLREVGERLQNTVLFIQSAARNDMQGLDVHAVAKDIESMVELLPQSFNDRFYFDSVMIQAIIERLGEQGIQINGMIVPIYSKLWGHDSLPLPWENDEKIEMVDFIQIPGGDELGDVDLLSYPFLIHEIGHNLLFRYDSAFTTRFKARLDAISNRMRLSSIADRGPAHSRAQERIEELRTYWMPTLNHKNWAHELAIDIMALWLCGPAYLAVFQDEMENPEQKPYQISQNHPPNAVRASALIEVGSRLGWNSHTGGLNRILQNWRQTQGNPIRPNHNQYVGLTNPQIVEACVFSALEACETLHLPKCTEEMVGLLRESIARGETPDFGIDVIIAVWLVHEERGEKAYEQWEAHVVGDLLTYIKQ